MLKLGSGVLKPKGGPKTKFVITTCTADRADTDTDTDTASLPGARLVFQHTAERTSAGTNLRVRVWMEGPLARVWAKIMGGGFKTSVRADLDRLIRLVEQP